MPATIRSLRLAAFRSRKHGATPICIWKCLPRVGTSDSSALTDRTNIGLKLAQQNSWSRLVRALEHCQAGGGTVGGQQLLVTPGRFWKAVVPRGCLAANC